MNKEDKLSVILTEDGSHTLYSARFRDSYHSVHGAIQESRHIYLHAGLVYVHASTQNIALLEVGLGTGLNYLLTREYAGRHPDLKINYHAYEKYPLSPEVANQLNYGALLNHDQFQDLHQLNWNCAHQVSPNFYLSKFLADIQDLAPDQQYNLIYFDAFAPEKQPEMWDNSLITKLCLTVKPGGVLVTYCCQGRFQRVLKSVGFQIEKLPGPPGKREILRATKREN